MSSQKDYYEVLGVKKEATADEIRKAYKKSNSRKIKIQRKR